MKKIILNSIAILGFTLSAISQDNIIIKMEKTGVSFPYTATDDNTDYSSGHSAYESDITEYNLTADSTVHFEMEIYNNTGVSKSWRVKRFNQVETPSDWKNYLCCGTTCFSVSSQNPYYTLATNFSVDDPQINTVEVANGEHGMLSFHVIAGSGSVGTGKYWLYLIDNNDITNVEDSIEINLSYTLGVNDLKQTPSFILYPNPSDDLVSINLNNNKSGTVKIVDLVGNIIYSESIVSNSKINVSEFKNGVYFVSIETNGIQSQMEKLVIKH